MAQEQLNSNFPICQSCSIPMEKPVDFGTEVDASQSKEYCVFCYSGGKFTEPELTLEEMIRKVARMMAKKMNLSEDEAGAIARVSVPELKRWKTN